MVAFQLAAVMSWPAAMGIVVLEGIIITLLVVTGLREWVMNVIPLALKQSISVGIGLFIAFIGFVDAGFVRRIPDVANTTVPVQLGVGNRLIGWPTVVFCFGLLLTIALVVRRTRGAILLGIIGTAIFAIILNAIVDVGPRVDAAGNVNPAGWALTVPSVPDGVVGSPDFGLLGAFSLGGSFAQVGVLVTVLFIFTLMLSDFFDTMGTVIGVANEGGLLDKDGRLPGVSRVLFVDSIAAAAGGVASTSSNTTYVESAAGVGEGARTGLASVVTALLFLVAVFLTPLGRGHPPGGGRPGPGRGRVPAHAAGRRHRLGRPRHRHPGLPHHRPDAVQLLHHQRHRGRLHRLCGHQGVPRPLARAGPAALDHRVPVRDLLRHRARGAPAGRVTAGLPSPDGGP